MKWAALYKWPGEIKDGNGKRQIIIDERATDALFGAFLLLAAGAYQLTPIKQACLRHCRSRLLCEHCRQGKLSANYWLATEFVSASSSPWLGAPVTCRPISASYCEIATWVIVSSTPFVLPGE